MIRKPKLAAVAAALALLLSSAVAAPPMVAAAVESPGGSGSYTTDNVGAVPGGACGQQNLRAYLTSDAPNKPVPTNDWWTSLVFKFSDASGTQQCAQNLALTALPTQVSVEDGKKASQDDGDSATPGVHISYHPGATLAPVAGKGSQDQSFHQYMRKDIVIAQVAGLGQTDVKVSNWSDWTVSTRQTDGTRTLDATFGQGLPFTWLKATGGNAKITLNAWTDVDFIVNGSVQPAPSASSIVVIGSGPTNSNGQITDRRYYAAYSPPGATWTKSSESGHWNDLVASAGGNFAIAALPVDSSTPAADIWSLAQSYAPYAHSPVTGTKANYVYDQATGKVRVTYQITANPIAGSGGTAGTVVSLLPHQWRKYVAAEPSSSSSFLARTYASPRGVMKTLVGATSFTTEDEFHGVLTEVPGVATAVPGSAERSRLETELATYLTGTSLADALRTQNTPTYGVGKALGRTARIAEIADQLGRPDVRDKALGDIRDTLTDWFTATSGKSRQVFRYSSAWSSLIGYPADFFSDTELNDHHFHYGYYVVAAATLARFDPAWADSYGPMVEMLIRDVNSPDRGDAMFPYLRYFNAYSGHDYAAGPAPYDGGNNQESSSEAMNAAYGMIMWGEATGNKAVRDAGVYIYTTQAAAINDYWFNDHGEALPAGYTSAIMPVIWTNGGTGGLFFGNGERAYKFGINTLPVTGGFLYLTASSVQRNYNALQAAPRLSGENVNEWRDIHLSALALADGPAALAGLNQLGNYSVPASGGLPYTNEHGETKAHTYHWIANLAALGRVDRSLTANYPGAVAFTKNGAKSYVVANVSSADLTVTFSDCTRVIAPRGKVTVTGPSAATLGSAPGGRGLSVPIPGWSACVAGPDPEEPVDPGNPVDPAHPTDPETPIAPVTRPAPPLTRTPGPGAKTSTLKITRVTVTKGRYRKSKKAIRVRKAARVTIKFATSADFKPNSKVSLVIGKTIGRAKLVRKSARTWVAHVKVKAKVNTKRGKVTIRYGKAGKKPSIANRKLLRIR